MSMQKVLAWNCRGTGSPDTLRAIVRMIRDHKPDILFLMETRVSSTRVRYLLKNSSFTNLAAIEARGFSGGLWVFWNETTTPLRVLSYTAQAMNVGILKDGQVDLVLTLVYASPTFSIRQQFHQYIETISPIIHVPWLIIGDFNQVTCQEDKRGGRPVRGAEVDCMLQMIDRCNLIKVGFTGPSFTWSNGQFGRRHIEQRLDQAWCNDLWLRKFPTALLHHLPRTHSDHHPLLLICNVDRPPLPTHRTFRFQACWIAHKEFTPFIQSAWNPIAGNLQSTLQQFTLQLEEWRKNVFGDLVRRRKRCLSRLEGVYRALELGPSLFLSRLEIKLQNEYNDIIRQEDIFWQHKNKIDWLSEGERNRRYFHMAMKFRRQVNRVGRLKNAAGEWVHTAEGLKTLIRDYYTSIFTATQCADMPEDLLMPSLSHSDRRWINRPVMPYEVEQALFQMGPYKAPGPDGYPPVFYQKNWSVVGPAVTEFVLQAFQKGHFPAEMNQTLVVLIPKTSSPQDATQFRPIALTNVVVKLITKIIANRLRRVIDKLISPTQCAFIPGRHSTDNVIIAQELIHTMWTKRGRKGFMAAKIDLKKAYDRVHWPFLQRLLAHVGFSQPMVQLIMFSITSASLSILWNGECLDPFMPQRGIRQGDPLAPYLFLLCMEFLGRKIEQAVADRRWLPIPSSRSGPHISHLFFADDLLLFGSATNTQAAVIAEILHEFCLISGQTVSVKKSQVLVSKNVSLTFQPDVLVRMGIRCVTNFGDYLGMPLLNGRTTRQTYAFILDKVRSKLSGWKAKTLSQASRQILVQSVISLMPMYAM